MRHPGHDTHLPGDRGQPLRMVRKADLIPLRRDSRPCEAPHLDRQGGRHQQPHQDIEAQGIRLSGRRLFLPQDSRCLIPEGQVLIWGRTQEKCKTHFCRGKDLLDILIRCRLYMKAAAGRHGHPELRGKACCDIVCGNLVPMAGDSKDAHRCSPIMLRPGDLPVPWRRDGHSRAYRPWL